MPSSGAPIPKVPGQPGAPDTDAIVRNAMEQDTPKGAPAPAQPDAPIQKEHKDEQDTPLSAPALPEIGYTSDITEWLGYYITVVDISDDQMQLKLTGPSPRNAKDVVQHTFWMPVNGDMVTVNKKEFPFVLTVRYTDDGFKGNAQPRVSKPKSAFVQHLPALGLGIATLASTLILNFWAPVRETVQASGLPPFLKQYLYPVLIPLMQLGITISVYLDSYTHKNKKEAKA